MNHDLEYSKCLPIMDKVSFKGDRCTCTGKFKNFEKLFETSDRKVGNC